MSQKEGEGCGGSEFEKLMSREMPQDKKGREKWLKETSQVFKKKAKGRQFKEGEIIGDFVRRRLQKTGISSSDTEVVVSFVEREKGRILERHQKVEIERLMEVVVQDGPICIPPDPDGVTRLPFKPDGTMGPKDKEDTKAYFDRRLSGVSKEERATVIERLVREMMTRLFYPEEWGDLVPVISPDLRSPKKVGRASLMRVVE